jgi:hypothetical protein
LAKERFATSNELLRGELARLKMKLTGHEGKERRGDEMERRFPFLKAHLEYIGERCDHPDGDVLPFPGKSGNSSFEYRDCCVLLSQVGEYQWQCLVKPAGFRPWRTIQRWRKRKMEVIRLEASIFLMELNRVADTWGIWRWRTCGNSRTNSVWKWRWLAMLWLSMPT